MSGNFEGHIYQIWRDTVLCTVELFLQKLKYSGYENVGDQHSNLLNGHMDLARHK